MAPRRPGTQPTETDPTLDIGAKRARVVGDDESSTQVEAQKLEACVSVVCWYGGGDAGRIARAGTGRKWHVAWARQGSSVQQPVDIEIEHQTRTSACSQTCHLEESTTSCSATTGLRTVGGRTDTTRPLRRMPHRIGQFHPGCRRLGCRRLARGSPGAIEKVEGDARVKRATPEGALIVGAVRTAARDQKERAWLVTHD
eukprot:scaffold23365_cov115-Isochrysis_galbana.AAC.6